MATARELTWKLGWQISNGPIKQADQATDDLTGKVNKLGKETQGLGSKAKTGFGGFGSAIKAGLGIFTGMSIGSMIKDTFQTGIKWGWEFDSTMQQNQIAFESMLGSTDKAKSMLSTLQTMAAKTPFEFPELATSAKKMLAFGFEADKIPGILTNIGDAASGLSLGSAGVDRISLALGQMKAKGKISGEEIRQLTETGIPAIQILADKFGISTAQATEFASKGILPVNESLDALISGMEDRFPNAMDKQSKSFSGLMSTLKDNTQMALGKVMKPLFDDLTNNTLPGLINKTQEFSDTYQQTGDLFGSLKKVIGEAFGPNTAEAIDIVKGAFDGLKDAVGFVSDNFNVFGPILAGVVFDITAMEVIGIVTGLMETWEASTFAQTLAQEGLNAALMSNPIGLVVGLIGLAVVAGIALYQNWDTVSAHLSSAWESIKNNFTIGVNFVIDKIDWLINKLNKIPGVEIPLISRLEEKVSPGKQIDHGMTESTSIVPTQNTDIMGTGLAQTIGIRGAATGGTILGSGAYLTGENGPEIITDTPGATVIPNKQTQQILSATNNNTNSSPVFQMAPISISVSGAGQPTEVAQEVKKVLGEELYQMLEDYFYKLSVKTPMPAER